MSRWLYHIPNKSAYFFFVPAGNTSVEQCQRMLPQDVKLKPCSKEVQPQWCWSDASVLCWRSENNLSKVTTGKDNLISSIYTKWFHMQLIFSSKLHQSAGFTGFFLLLFCLFVFSLTLKETKSQMLLHWFYHSFFNCIIPVAQLYENTILNCYRLLRVLSPTCT